MRTPLTKLPTLCCVLFLALCGLAAPAKADDDQQATQQRGLDQPAENLVGGLGRRIPTFALPDTTGVVRSLADFEDVKCFVVIFMGTQCPIANAYVPDLNALQQKYGDQHVQVVGVNSNLSDTAATIAKHHKEFAIQFPVLIDEEQVAADVFGASRTPEAFVLDGRGQIRYQGRIDDRVGYRVRNAKPQRADVEEAVKEVLADKTVSVAKTEVQGCLITRSSQLKTKGKITYAKHVSRILHERCANCHHPETAAPFSLLTYDEARNWSQMIKETVLERRMPPWDVDSRYGKFSNDLRMTKEEIDTVVAWIDDGAPFGDKEDLPEPRQFETGWSIGKPDEVLRMPKEYTVQAAGTVKYQYFVTPTNFKEDVWVQAAEARPGNRAVVHHIIAFVRPKGSFGGRMTSIGGYAPGEEPVVYPLGVGRRIPAGSEIVWQVHYTPTGKVETDRSELGLVFCKEPPKRAAKGALAANRRFKIPAGDDYYKVVAKSTITEDIDLLSLMPHMHLRGKDFRYTARYPDGKTEVLLNVPNYDFNWQHRYRFAEPLRLPRGTTLECVAHFDNSTTNPANPDPTKTVRWGDQTWEEMMIGFYAYVDAEPIDEPGATDESTQTKDTPASEKTEDSGAEEESAAAAKTDAREKEDAPAIGKVLRRTYPFDESGKTMEYGLYLPKGYVAGKSYPLIVALHGLYSNPQQILNYPGFTKRADAHGYILVAPMGYNNHGWYGSLGKRGGRRSKDPENLGELSERDVMNVLKLTREQFDVDAERIYLYGHSMGGGGALHLAMKYPSIWAGIAPMAPAAYRNLEKLVEAKHIPAFVVQGDKDRLVPVIGTRRWVDKMKELEMDYRYIEVKGGDHIFVAFKYFDEIFEFFNKRPRAAQVPVGAGEAGSQPSEADTSQSLP